LADATISAGHARALLGTPDRSFQEELARRAVAEGLTVRAVEEAVRLHGRASAPDGDERDGEAVRGEGSASSPAPGLAPAPPPRRLAAPGVLELEELLSTYLNTRVKVDMGAKRGRVVVDFATLEDLERIYKLIVGSVPA
jgi:ParB family chromosome partitioning protein